jgi:hypothetical protein
MSLLQTNPKILSTPTPSLFTTQAKDKDQDKKEEPKLSLKLDLGSEVISSDSFKNPLKQLTNTDPKD